MEKPSSRLLQLIEFGFPLDFNRNCPLNHETGNHKSVTQFPNDIDVYTAEKLKYDALLGPFESHPVASGHCFPFMSRAKPNSDRCQHWSQLAPGCLVNAGIDKTSYLGSAFSLMFPTDDITTELTRLRRGVLLFKVDVSGAFWHIKVDSGDYHLLGLKWHGFNMCVPFWMRHRSQMFQCLSVSIRYIMHYRGFPMIDYIDD